MKYKKIRNVSEVGGEQGKKKKILLSSFAGDLLDGLSVILWGLFFMVFHYNIMLNKKTTDDTSSPACVDCA